MKLLALAFLAGTATLAAPHLANATPITLAVGSNGQSTTYTGVISGNTTSKLANLTKNGAGTLILSGASTYIGNTTINGGLINFTTGTVSATGAFVAARPTGANAAQVGAAGLFYVVPAGGTTLGLKGTISDREGQARHLLPAPCVPGSWAPGPGKGKKPCVFAVFLAIRPAHRLVGMGTRY